MDIINEKLGRVSSLNPPFPKRKKAKYLKLEPIATKRELDKFWNCKYPNGHIIKELSRFNILWARYKFRIYWNKYYANN